MFNFKKNCYRFVVFLLLLIVASCNTTNKITGYVEGDYVYYSASSSGILKDVYVGKGQEITPGMPLFALDSTALTSEIESAQAQIQAEQNTLNDLNKGNRPQQIKVIVRQIAQAQASYKNAQQEYGRAKTLLNQGVVSGSYYDQKEMSLDIAKAHVEELSFKLKALTLETQADKLNTLSNLTIARNKMLQAKERLQESAPVANSAGRVEDIFFKAGEFVQTGSPVISMLPPHNIYIRFFVPQSSLSELSLNKEVNVFVNNTNKAISAKITYISSKGEYTPPQIYSNEFRDKMVFLIEATPLNAEGNLRPGLPVDITL